MKAERSRKNSVQRGIENRREANALAHRLDRGLVRADLVGVEPSALSVVEEVLEWAGSPRPTPKPQAGRP
jgi:hypothetical protein